MNLWAGVCWRLWVSAYYPCDVVVPFYNILLLKPKKPKGNQPVRISKASERKRFVGPRIRHSAWQLQEHAGCWCLSQLKTHHPKGVLFSE